MSGSRLTSAQRAVLALIERSGLWEGWRGGWWTGDHRTVHGRTVMALADRGLIEQGRLDGAVMATRWAITPAGRAALEAGR